MSIFWQGGEGGEGRGGGMTVIHIIIGKVRNSTCPLARDKWIFRRTTKIANIVVRRTTWVAAGSVTRQRSSYFGVRF